MHRRRLISDVALALAALLAACDDTASPVRIVDVDEATYLRGVQVSKLEIAPGHEVVRSELYLDGLRVAADELAPFELTWDTSKFSDGAHTLVARIYLANGSYIDGKTAMWIDNMPPRLGTIAAVATRGAAFEVPASDNFKLTRVEISRGVEGELPLVVTAQPLRFSWPWPCGATAIHIRALDAAGGEATADVNVLGVEPNDRDCDGYRAAASGGDDCDDDSPGTHPGVMDVPEGYDLNCDGVVAPLPGIDFDGDGVPSIVDGGNDCNDSDPAIHGPSYSFKHVLITSEGAPITWAPGEAVLEGYGAFWQLYLNRAGVIEQYLPGSNDGVVRRTQLGTGANAGSIAEYSGDTVAFGSGRQIVIVKRTGDSWARDATIPAGGDVGKLAIAHDDDGYYAAFQIGTELWYARSSGASWNLERVAIVGPEVQSIVNISRLREQYISIEVHTRQSGWFYTRYEQGQPFVTGWPASEDPTANIWRNSQSPHVLSVVARSEGAGSAIYEQSSAIPLLVTRHIAALVALDDHSLLVKYSDSQATSQIITINPSVTRAHVVQDAPDMGDFDPMSWRRGRFSVFASQGVVHYLASSIAAVDDPAGDGVDRDCDKLD